MIQATWLQAELVLLVFILLTFPAERLRAQRMYFRFVRWRFPAAAFDISFDLPQGFEFRCLSDTHTDVVHKHASIHHTTRIAPKTCMALRLPATGGSHVQVHPTAYTSRGWLNLSHTPGIISGQPFCHWLMPAREGHGLARSPKDPNAFSRPTSHPLTLAKSPVVSDPML